ncbi:MAG TPA: GNAT family N-acetyltransferase [Candidatus Dormibacteraeota bacterium]
MAATGDDAIRPVDPPDLVAWIGLSNPCRHWQLDHEALRFEDCLRQPDEPFLRLAAYAPDGSMAGLAEASLGEYGERWKERAGEFVAVAPGYRRQGVGACLLAEVERFASTANVRWLEGETRERDLPAALPLLTKRGFVEPERYQASRQEPATIDISGLEALRDRLRREGIETVDFAAIDSTGARESLYRCWMAIHRDMPHGAHVDWEDASSWPWTARRSSGSPTSCAGPVAMPRWGIRVSCEAIGGAGSPAP